MCGGRIWKLVGAYTESSLSNLLAMKLSSIRHESSISRDETSLGLCR